MAYGLASEGAAIGIPEYLDISGFTVPEPPWPQAEGAKAYLHLQAR